MGIRFRKYLTIGKLLRINISKSGASVTAGIKGASINIGKNGTYLNTGVPGTGLYSREKLSGTNPNKVGKRHSEEAINRAQIAIAEFDAYQQELELKNKKSDIAPDMDVKCLDELFLAVAY